jgi:hypothetical protein
VKYIRKFFESVSIYDVEWQTLAPKSLCFKKGDHNICFKLGNVMKHFDMIQITYTVNDGEEWGIPDTLEFDLYFLKSQGKHFKMDVDITFGNKMVSEFSLEVPNKVNVIQYTSYHSKWDPTETVFGFDDQSLQKIIKMFNTFDGFEFSVEQFKFLDQRDNWRPTS